MPQKFLSIRDFEKTQHYKQRNPPWVKLHKTMYGDPAFQKLSVMSRYLYIGLLTLASESDNRVLNDPSWIAQRLVISPSDIDLKPLYRSGLLLASEASIRRYHQTEKRREETEERESSDASASPPTAQLVPREKKRPIPLPPDFKFTPDLREWALGKGCKEPFAEFERFISKAESKGWTYVDWPKAYKNWVLNELKWARERHA